MDDALNQIKNIYDPNRNGFNDNFDPKKNGISDAFNPNKNGVNDAFSGLGGGGGGNTETPTGYNNTTLYIIIGTVLAGMFVFIPSKKQ